MLKFGKGKNKQIICVILTLMLVLSPLAGYGSEETDDQDQEQDAVGQRVVSIANDITLGQRDEILDHFGVSLDEIGVQFITTTIEDEYEYLGDVATREVIGNRTISSAYVEILPEGEGITVDTHNITWVTREMYTSALVTAGLNNAYVSAAAPFPVSGTGALTGVIKAFEEATGKELPEENKKVAHEEIVILQELTDDETENSKRINQLIQQAKEQVLNQRPLDEDEIENIIRNLADEMEIQLDDDQINRITNFLIQFNHIDIDLDQLRNQIERLAEDPAIRSFFIMIFERISGWTQNIIDMLKNLR